MNSFGHLEAKIEIKAITAKDKNCRKISQGLV